MMFGKYKSVPEDDLAQLKILYDELFNLTESTASYFEEKYKDKFDDIPALAKSYVNKIHKILNRMEKDSNLLLFLNKESQE